MSVYLHASEMPCMKVHQGVHIFPGLSPYFLLITLINVYCFSTKKIITLKIFLGEHTKLKELII